MDGQLNKIRSRVTWIVTLVLLVTPFLGMTTLVFFGLLDFPMVMALMSKGHIPSMILSVLVLANWWFYHSFSRLEDRSFKRKTDAPELVFYYLQRFSRHYWALLILYTLAIIVLHHTGIPGGITDNNKQVMLFTSLLMTVTIIVGLPAYLISMDQLSKMAKWTGLFHVQNSIRSKILLLGAFMPILSYSFMMAYYWQKTGYLTLFTLLLWGSMALATGLISVLTVRSLKHSLSPVQLALGRTGATAYNELAGVRPASTDEIGILTQTLGRVFERLSDKEQQIRAVVDNAAEGIIVVTEAGRIDTFNQAAQRLFGYPSQEIRGQPLSRLLPFLNENRGKPVLFSGEREETGIDRNGHNIHLSVLISDMQTRNKRMFTYIVADRSERLLLLEQQQKAETRYRNLVETAQDLVWSMDANGYWTYVNAASLKIYGYTPEEMIGKHLRDFQLQESIEQDTVTFQDVQQGKKLNQYETIHLDKQGNRHYLSFNATPEMDEHGKVIQITGTARDISDQKAYEKQLTYQAEHDVLTGLYNRRYFQQELERVVALMPRQDLSCAVLYIDLDQFKPINDTLGHDAGDRLLIEVSNMLTSSSRQGELLARYGGDEFTMLLYNVNQHTVITAAENFRLLFERYRFIDSGQSFNLYCSIGAALITPHTRSADEVLTQADHACNIAKACGRNQVVLYDSADQDISKVAEDTGWANRVTDMIENNRLILAYQPIIDIQHNNITQYEVLIRMPSEDGEVISPGGFIPAAERFGLIHSLDNWVIEHAIAKLAGLRQAGQSCHFSINLSPRAHEDTRLADFIYKRLSENNVPPEWLTFELNESRVISKLGDNQRMIKELTQLGCRFALDNFGSGMQTFHTIKALPISSVNIDGDLIRSITSSNVDHAMVSSINSIAHELRLTTVAKYVEDEATLKCIEEIGIDQAQGHYIGKPLNHLIHDTELPHRKDDQQHDSSA